MIYFYYIKLFKCLNIMIYNATCALNITCYKPTFLKQTVLDIKRQVSPETMIVGDFNTSLSSIDRYCKGKNQ